jgi:transcriptional regulator with XRE-family HTH domain
MTSGDKEIQKLGLRVTERRKRLGLTQTQLARRAGVAVSTIYELESGLRSNIRILTLSRIARVLMLGTDELLSEKTSGGSDDLPGPPVSLSMLV